jgi:hypothetical protein
LKDYEKNFLISKLVHKSPYIVNRPIKSFLLKKKQKAKMKTVRHKKMKSYIIKRKPLAKYAIGVTKLYAKRKFSSFPFFLFKARKFLHFRLRRLNFILCYVFFINYGKLIAKKKKKK